MTNASTDHVAALVARERELRAEYRAIVQTQTVRLHDHTVALHQLSPELESRERRRRERAWRLETDRRCQDAPRFIELWTQLVAVRGEMALDAGEASYTDLRRRELGGSPDASDLGRRAQLAVEECVTSVLVRLHERRRRQLGIRAMRPWDVGASPPEFPSDPVFATTGMAVEAVNRALAQSNCEVSVATPASRAPSELLQSDADLEKLVAECGEALAQILFPDAAQCRPGVRHVSAFALAVLVLHGTEDVDRGGEIRSRLNRARIRHLEQVLFRWSLGAMQDAFEEWTYSHAAQAGDEATVGAIWSSLWLRFLPAVDWAGMEPAMQIDWQRHHDLFLRPVESVFRMAQELEVIRRWSEASDQATWFRELDLGGRARAGSSWDTSRISELDLLDVARWMEDTIEELERLR